jgi:hypothetical protein
MASSNLITSTLTISGDAIGDPKPHQLLNSVAFTAEGKGGFIADIDPTYRVFNQPFHGSTVTVSPLPDSPALKEKLFELAAKDGWSRNAKTREMRVDKAWVVSYTGKYGADFDDAYEGPPMTRSKTWNMLVFTNPDGKVLWGYKAAGYPSSKLKGIDGLPPVLREPNPDPFPEYISRLPNDAFADAVEDRPNALFTRERGLFGPEFKAYIGKILPNAVPAITRKNFEADVMELRSREGTLEPEEIERLKKTYQKVANAYSPQQWDRWFAPLGLESEQFGSVW